SSRRRRRERRLRRRPPPRRAAPCRRLRRPSHRRAVPRGRLRRPPYRRPSPRGRGVTLRLSPVLTGMTTYPCVRLAEEKARVAARGVGLLDFGVGEPREETPAFIREALVAALEPMSTYPAADGLAELRAAIAAWAARRFGAALDPDSQVLPT